MALLQETVEGPAIDIYAVEADHVATCLEQGKLESPLMTWQDSLDNAHALDQWRASVGVRFYDSKPRKTTRDRSLARFTPTQNLPFPKPT